ncbi:MAG TPA: hypothetical protein VFF45_00195 [Bacilli bacterium]|nr:hypothetical protein [Bacilli bacterium]
MSAPRKIPITIAFDVAEDEVYFTRSTLKADPDAQDLLVFTDGWTGLVEQARTKERLAREALADADAARIIANDRLDRVCERFGDDLFRAVDKNRSAARWTQFFNVAVSRFIRQALRVQVERVGGWLKSNDPVLEQHRAGLTTWSKAAGDALQQTAAVATMRGAARMAREQLAEDLTRERDGLHDALSARARERGLPRDWPDLFFRKAPRAASSAGEGQDDAPEGDDAG